MFSSDSLRLVLQLNTPVSVLVGLWIAARWLPDVRTWLGQIGAASYVLSRAGQLLVWVVLGVLFAGPVADWVGLVVSGAILVSTPGSMGPMTTLWGSIPFAYFSGVTILTIVIVYALVVRIGYRLWPEAAAEAAEEEGAGNSLAWEEWFVLLAVASLVTHLVLSVIRSFLWLPPLALPNGYLMLGSQLVVPVAMLVGLWIARRWLPALTAALGRVGLQSFVSNRAGRLILWIAMGAFFGAPLIDLAGMLLTAVQLLLGPLANVGAMSTVWGTESVTGYNKIWILTTLVIYLLVGWIGYRLWPESHAAEADRSTLSVEQVLLLLAGISLVNRFAQALVLGVVWLPIPNAVDMGRLSAVGVLAAWLLGVALVGVVLLVLFNRLRRHQPIE